MAQSSRTIVFDLLESQFKEALTALEGRKQTRFDTWLAREVKETGALKVLKKIEALNDEIAAAERAVRELTDARYALNASLRPYGFQMGYSGIEPTPSTLGKRPKDLYDDIEAAKTALKAAYREAKLAVATEGSASLQLILKQFADTVTSLLAT